MASCPTSLRVVIKHVHPGQVVWLLPKMVIDHVTLASCLMSPRVVSHGGDSLSMYLDMLSNFSQQCSSSTYLGKLSHFSVDWSLSRYPSTLSDFHRGGLQSHTQPSCPTSPKGGVSSRRLIEHVLWQVVWLPQEWSSSMYLCKLSNLSKSRHWAHTWASCMTSSESGVSSRRLTKHVQGKVSWLLPRVVIEHIPRQVVWLPLRVIIKHVPGQVVKLPKTWSLSIYLGKLSIFPKSGVSLGVFIKYLPGQVVWLLLRVMCHWGDSSSMYPGKLTDFSGKWFLPSSGRLV